MHTTMHSTPITGTSPLERRTPIDGPDSLLNAVLDLGGLIEQRRLGAAAELLNEIGSYAKTLPECHQPTRVAHHCRGIARAMDDLLGTTLEEAAHAWRLGSRGAEPDARSGEALSLLDISGDALHIARMLHTIEGGVSARATRPTDTESNELMSGASGWRARLSDPLTDDARSRHLSEGERALSDLMTEAATLWRDAQRDYMNEHTREWMHRCFQRLNAASEILDALSPRGQAAGVTE